MLLTMKTRSYVQEEVRRAAGTLPGGRRWRRSQGPVLDLSVQPSPDRGSPPGQGPDPVFLENTGQSATSLAPSWTHSAGSQTLENQLGTEEKQGGGGPAAAPTPIRACDSAAPRAALI